MPCRWRRTAATSARVSTTGKRRGVRARTMPSTAPKVCPSTARYRNRTALSAWFLGRCADVPVGGEPRQKGRNVAGPKLRRVPHPIEHDVPADPHRVGALGPTAVVAHAHSTPYSLHQPWWLAPIGGHSRCPRKRWATVAGGYLADTASAHVALPASLVSRSLGRICGWAFRYAPCTR